MSWSEIKATPMIELQGLLKAFGNYGVYHAFDGYSSKDIETMAKDKPEVRSQYAESMYLKETFEHRAGVKKRAQGKSLKEMFR